MCGENVKDQLNRIERSGSSPRVRGKPRAGQLHRNQRRLIPACAGKTKAQYARRLPAPAHPRVCGENRGVMTAPNPGGGSSPRVRGKRLVTRGSRRRCGLIPACAGKTVEILMSLYPMRAHPRVCGENLGVNTDGEHYEGSSPRVRGKLRPRGIACSPMGLIPACAGKTPDRTRETQDPEAHPRVCGENASPGIVKRRSRGSSPRVRGKRTPDAPK